VARHDVGHGLIVCCACFDIFAVKLFRQIDPRPGDNPPKATDRHADLVAYYEEHTKIKTQIGYFPWVLLADRKDDLTN
jgi:hypothetical protein